VGGPIDVFDGKEWHMALIERLFVACLVMAQATSGMADDETASGGTKVFATPQEVFEAFREAGTKHDWRTVFLCLTPERRDDHVFETWFQCQENIDNANVAKVLKKYGVEENAFQAEYFKLYQEKHGVDLAKLEREYEKKKEQAVSAYLKKHPQTGKEAVAVPTSELAGIEEPPDDEELVRKAAIGLISDKIGFFADAANALSERSEERPAFGELKAVRIQGDKATGRADQSGNYHYEKKPGKMEIKKADPPVPMIFHFQKLRGSWLIGQQEVVDTGLPKIDAAKH
jgi:hypothetical protein